MHFLFTWVIFVWKYNLFDDLKYCVTQVWQICKNVRNQEGTTRVHKVVIQEANPSIHPIQGRRGLKPIPAAIEWEAGCTLEGPHVYQSIARLMDMPASGHNNVLLWSDRTSNCTTFFFLSLINFVCILMFEFVTVVTVKITTWLD